MCRRQAARSDARMTSAPPTQPEPPQTTPLVLFDGVCNLCNGIVTFIIARDPEARLRFAALQSERGQAVLRRHRLPLSNYDSFVVLDNGKIYLKSEAFLRIMRYLSWPWPLMQYMRLVPRVLRDWGYDLVGRNRYRLFGRQDRCMMPTPDVMRRFLT